MLGPVWLGHSSAVTVAGRFARCTPLRIRKMQMPHLKRVRDLGLAKRCSQREIQESLK